MKARVTVSVSKPLLREAERAGRAKGLKSRSAIVEEALGLLAKAARDAEWERELDEYYGTRTKAEVDEENAYLDAVKRSYRGRDFDREGG